MALATDVFPENIKPEPLGGPTFITKVVRFPTSGKEQRNRVRQGSLGRWRVALDDRPMQEVHAAISFFRARQGRFQGFPFKDWSDYKTVDPNNTTSAVDTTFGTGDDTTTDFQLKKEYISGVDSYLRTIYLPKSGTVAVAINGVTQTEGVDYTLNYQTGVVSFTSPPANGLALTWGGEFFTPVRFDNDEQEINVRTFQYGSWPALDLVEIVP